MKMRLLLIILFLSFTGLGYSDSLKLTNFKREEAPVIGKISEEELESCIAKRTIAYGAFDIKGLSKVSLLANLHNYIQYPNVLSATPEHSVMLITEEAFNRHLFPIGYARLTMMEKLYYQLGLVGDDRIKAEMNESLNGDNKYLMAMFLGVHISYNTLLFQGYAKAYGEERAQKAICSAKSLKEVED